MATLPQEIYDGMKAKGYDDASIAQSAKEYGYDMPVVAVPQGRVAETGGDIGQTIGSTASNVYERGKKISEVTPSSEPNPLRALAKIIKEGAGAIGDVVGGAVIGAGKVALPQGDEDVVSGAVGSVVENPEVQSLISSYGEWKKAHPDAALALETGTNMLDVATVGAFSAPKKGVSTVLKSVAEQLPGGDIVKKAGTEMVAASKAADVESAARVIAPEGKVPDLGVDVREAGLAKGGVTTKGFGPMKRLDVDISQNPLVSNIANAVLDTPGFKVKTSVGATAKNFNALVGEIDKLDTLRDSLAVGTKAIINTQGGEFLNALKSGKTEIVRYIGGDIEKIYDGLADGFQKWINKTDDKGARIYKGNHQGLTKAIKEWKQELGNQYPKIWDPNNPSFSSQRVAAKDVLENARDILAQGLGPEKAKQYTDAGKKMRNLMIAQRWMSRSAKEITNISGTQALLKNHLVQNAVKAVGLSAVFGAMFALGSGPSIALLATLALGGTVKLGGEVWTAVKFKKHVGMYMEKLGENMKQAKTPDDVKILKEEYINTAVLMANMLELEADERNR